MKNGSWPSGVTAPVRWTRVVEADTVPKTYFKGTRRLPLTGAAAGTEPIGKRIIEVPEEWERVELRDPHASFVSYVPPGSLAKGEALVTTGAGGKTIPCAICHGAGLKGLGDARHRRTFARQHRAANLLFPDRRPRRHFGRADEGCGREAHRRRRDRDRRLCGLA
jgi:hypothetical protein